MPKLLTGLLLTWLITVINLLGSWGQNRLLLTSLTLPVGGRSPGTDPRQELFTSSEIVLEYVAYNQWGKFLFAKIPARSGTTEEKREPRAERHPTVGLSVLRPSLQECLKNNNLNTYKGCWMTFQNPLHTMAFSQQATTSPLPTRRLKSMVTRPLRLTIG